MFHLHKLRPPPQPPAPSPALCLWDLMTPGTSHGVCPSGTGTRPRVVKAQPCCGRWQSVLPLGAEGGSIARVPASCVCPRPACEECCCAHGCSRVGPDVWVTAAGISKGGCDWALASRRAREVRLGGCVGRWDRTPKALGSSDSEDTPTSERASVPGGLGRACMCCPRRARGCARCLQLSHTARHAPTITRSHTCMCSDTVACMHTAHALTHAHTQLHTRRIVGSHTLSSTLH